MPTCPLVAFTVKVLFAVIAIFCFEFKVKVPVPVEAVVTIAIFPVEVLILLPPISSVFKQFTSFSTPFICRKLLKAPPVKHPNSIDPSSVPPTLSLITCVILVYSCLPPPLSLPYTDKL